MKFRVLVVLLALPVWACADKPSDPGTASSPATTVIGVVETPLLLASRVTVCLATPPILGPGAIASAVVPFKGGSDEPTGWDLFKKDVADACGPPYVAKPHYDLLQ